MLSPAGRFYVPKSRGHSDHGKLVAGPLLVRAWRWMRGDGVTAMADNIPQWSASDAVDRLRVAIERQQAATERQTATTRWLNVVMTALTILMAVPAVVQFWRFAHSEVWPVVRLWRPW